MTAGSIRFYLRAYRKRGTPERHLGRWRFWVVYDAATGQPIGEITDVSRDKSEWDALKQQLRMIRSRHHESLEAPLIDPGCTGIGTPW